MSTVPPEYRSNPAWVGEDAYRRGERPAWVEAQAQRLRSATQLCEWFALCTNAATLTRPHPTLGDVPICPRCNDKIERLST